MFKLHILAFAVFLAVYFADCQPNVTLNDGGDSDQMRGKRCSTDRKCAKKGGECYLPGQEPSGAKDLGKCRSRRCKCYKVPLTPVHIVDGPFGGIGGSAFTDQPFSKDGGNITALDIWSKEPFIRGIQVTYGSLQAPLHGRMTGDKTTFNLTSNEKIIFVFGTSEDYLNSIGMVTDLFRYSLVGTSDQGNTFFASHTNCYLAFFSGRSGSWIDAISLHWLCSAN